MEAGVDAIPKEATSVVAYMWGCGDICCCCQPHICAKFAHDKYIHTLWKGTFISGYDCMEPDEKEDMKAEYVEACKHYNINVDFSSESIFDWEGERAI